MAFGASYMIRLLLITVNGIVILLGLGLVFLGVATYVGRDQILGLIGRLPAYGQVIGPYVNRTMAMLDTNQTSLLGAGASVLVIGGCTICMIGAFGFFGALDNNYCLLVAYAAVLVVLISSEISATVLYVAFEGEVTTRVINYMHNTIKYRYIGQSITNNTVDFNPDIISLAWDVTMFYFECCGNTNYTDFQVNATNWVSEVQYGSLNITSVVPFTCCKMQGIELTQLLNYFTLDNVANLTECLTTAHPRSTNLDSCHAVISTEFSRQILKVQVLTGFLVVGQVVGLILSVLVICTLLGMTV